MPAFPLTLKRLAMINLAVYLIAALVRWTTSFDLMHFFACGWNEIQEGYGLGALRFVTAIFSHDPSSPFHLIGNMAVLLFLGNFVYSEIGGRGILHLFLVGGLVGGVGHIALGAVAGNYAPAIGASGAVYAVAVYLAFMAPRLRIFFNFEACWVVGVYVGVGIYLYMNELFTGFSGRVSHGGHLGGALYGALAFKFFRGYYLRLNFKDGSWFPGVQRWRENRQKKALVNERHTLDELLDKVHREGMGSLSGSERKFLEKASKKRRDP